MPVPQKTFEAAWNPRPPGEVSPDEIVFISRPGGDILAPCDAPDPCCDFTAAGGCAVGWTKLGIGRIGDAPVSLVTAPPSAEAPDGCEWRSPRTLLARIDTTLVAALSRASMLASWDWDHRFCGRCGTATVRDVGEAARVCPSCGHRSYPRVSPAMIVLIEASHEAGFNEPRILLAHNNRFPDGVYSCVAGYVDAGETLEATVLREIREEVGLDAAPPRYVRSQAWPLPHSLMLGFRTEAAGDPVPDGVEIADARWFASDNLPRIPKHGTIARTLIDDWLDRIGAPAYRDRE